MKVISTLVFCFPILLIGQVSNQSSFLDLSSEVNLKQTGTRHSAYIQAFSQTGKQNVLQSGQDNQLELNLISNWSEIDILQTGDNNQLQTILEGDLQAKIIQHGSNQLYLEMTGVTSKQPVSIIQDNFSLPVYIQIKN